VKATGGAWNRKTIGEKLGVPISEEEYQAFVEPFEGISRLETIRSSLRPEEIVEPIKAPTSETTIAGFPENLSLSKEELASFKAVHKLLVAIKHSSLGLRDTDTFAQKNRHESRMAHVLKFLWILGRYGEFEKKKGTYLAVGAQARAAQGICEIRVGP
jgi:hypothetical protein